ncbi:nicotinamide-nucleotide amidase [Marinobacter nanhaiticus D15-8W]|uniref:Nicotinamide-nucleotide amidase n=1 Tax=Marinobacter nanhaiticus D15-8W TaxID=626887 RepID=N6W3T0_9GAMM|nr:nicotinamide-nucleotide amidase [Marinobacter nanhaiticus]ENO17185.1 nicotinamide-nucleotide amidase [Marinobacter nanhaiticus D15-8W]BES72150.1 nicotinamide-nucleotide amidase [Marinobacter nanhaiticus D15-8W]
MSISDDVLEEAAVALGDLLRERGLMITTAESCTGGWVAKALTDRAGSSDYVHSGLVTYSNEAKRVLLEVTDKSLTEHGAVSEPVVREMVAGALAATGAQVAVSISGVAGPGGGSDEKPVGTVWFAWGRSPADTESVVEHFSGDRDAIRRQAVLFALQGVRGFLQEQG